MMWSNCLIPCILLQKILIFKELSIKKYPYFPLHLGVAKRQFRALKYKWRLTGVFWGKFLDF